MIPTDGPRDGFFSPALTRMIDSYILAHRIRISEIYPGIENLILPMLSYPGRQVTSSCEIAY